MEASTPFDLEQVPFSPDMGGSNPKWFHNPLRKKDKKEKPS